MGYPRGLISASSIHAFFFYKNKLFKKFVLCGAVFEWKLNCGGGGVVSLKLEQVWYTRAQAQPVRRLNEQFRVLSPHY